MLALRKKHMTPCLLGSDPRPSAVAGGGPRAVPSAPHSYPLPPMPLLHPSLTPPP
uniref:Uncharacterized protein n=1 Tax=Arundo donax TaxID=35708 RepID=A0A0A9BX19_ARUDO